MPLVGTVTILYLILARVPYGRLVTVLHEADYALFLTCMVANGIIYVAWDTLVLTVALRWFHGPVRYAEVLPVRAASYIVALFNTNAARASLAVFVSRILREPLLPIGSTVIFLLLTEYTHLALWATLGIVGFGSDATRPLLWVPPVVAAFWLMFFAYARAGRASAPGRGAARSGISGWVLAPWRSALLNTFRIAPARRYGQMIALRAPVFFVSLCLHYFAAPAFGFSIPFGELVTFLPVVFMVAALPITVARLGTTQAAWVLLFGHAAAPERLLAFSVAAHLTFALTRALAGIILLPRAYSDVIKPSRSHGADADALLWARRAGGNLVPAGK